jgi:hypothetical protein
LSVSIEVLAKDLGYLLSPLAIRNGAKKIYDCAKQGKTHFILDEEKLDDAADFVVSVIKDNYPDLDIPYHSRWRHFSYKGVSLLDGYNDSLSRVEQSDRARIGLDLIVPSVLLDAGAGAQWEYSVPHTDLKVGRSEGLGLASLNMFLSGGFSHTKSRPLMTHSDVLSELKMTDLQYYFQVSDSNPLVGLEGRLKLIKALGRAMKNKPEIFPNGRPGDLVDYLTTTCGNTIEAKSILNAVFLGFGDIWPGRTNYHGVNLGDVWQYKPFGEGIDSFICFHKLSQWLTYSIAETLMSNGFNVVNVEELTGLAEYRNGGLFIDTGVLTLREPSDAQKQHQPSSELIIEWRALTIHLLDLVAERIRHKLNMTNEQWPLVKILEGGTWLAGRRLAEQLRESSSAPILLDSDGTVF